MGRRSEYDKKANKDGFNREEIIKNMLNKMELTPKEFAKVLLTDEKTVKNRIKKLCSSSEGMFEEADFKDGKPYKFSKEWNGILMALLDSSEYDGRSKDMNLNMYLEHIDRLLSSIDTYIEEDTQKEIKAHPLYSRSKVEKELYDQIENKLGKAINIITTMPLSLRFSVLAGIHQALDSWYFHLIQMYTTDLIEKAKYKQNAMDIEKQMMDQMDKSLEELLYEKLKQEMALKELKPILDEHITDTVEEQAIINALFEELIMERWRSEANEQIKSQVQEVQEHIRNIRSNKSILDKVSRVLDADQPKEQLLLQWIEKILRITHLNEQDQRSSAAAKYLIEKTVIENASDAIRALNEKNNR